MTEDAANVWGKSLDYLKPVLSDGDQLSPNYEARTELTAEEVKTKLTAKFGDLTFPEDASKWITVKTLTDSKMVKEADVCGKTVSGVELRLSLIHICFLPRFGVQAAVPVPEEGAPAAKLLPVRKNPDIAGCQKKLAALGRIDYLLKADKSGVSALLLHLGEELAVYDFGAENAFFELVAQSSLPKRTFDVKPDYLRCHNNGETLSNVSFDAVIAAYLLNSGSKTYSICDLALHFIPAVSYETEEGCEEIALLPADVYKRQCLDSTADSAAEFAVDAAEDSAGA